LLTAGLFLGGCKSASVSEVRGKTSFGPEFRNRGNNTHEIRYDVRQSVDVEWDNGWRGDDEGHASAGARRPCERRTGPALKG
jgi:hypothetical protein